MASCGSSMSRLPLDCRNCSTEATHPLDLNNALPWAIDGVPRRDKRVGMLSHTDHYGKPPFAIPRNTEVTALITLLRVCAKNKDLNGGASLHDEIVRKGLLEKCSDSLASMYAKCGALSQAKELLETHKSRNVSSWTALIAAYARQGQGRNALVCFDQMQHMGLSPNAMTFASVLKACASIKAVYRGEQIYEEIARQGLLATDIVLGNALVDMYVKCAALAKAQHVLEELPSRDVVSWNSLIAGHAQFGHGEHALECFDKMQEEGITPDVVTFISILKACGSIRATDKGKQIHEELRKRGLISNSAVVGTALVDMYAKCGLLNKAEQVLKELPFRNVITWNALITGYAQLGQAKRAMDCFEQMHAEGFSADAVTFAYLLKACGALGKIDKGKQIHDQITQQGLLRSNRSLGSALVDMYAKCGALAKAQQVLEELSLRDVVCWNALIAGYAQQGQGEQALHCFEQMKREGLSPSYVTFSSILKACSTVEAMDKVELICNEIERQGLLEKHIVLGTVLVDMYVKGGALAKARRVLEKLPHRDVVSWSTLIRGYVEQGQGERALECFEHMQNEGLSPDSVTFACILKACGTVGAVDIGKQIHDEIYRQGLLANNTMLGNALVDMYAKCGDVAKARGVLKGLPSRDVISWSALIAGYAQQGQHEQILDCLEQMELESLIPDVITFSSVLNACCHLGLVEDAYMYFESMSIRYGIKPDLEHYTCMVDMLGRSGHLDKAIKLIQEMPSSKYSAVWSALLSACQKWGDVSVARWAFEQAVQVDKTDVTPYILMANIYAVAGMEDAAANVEALRMENKAWTNSEPRVQFLSGFEIQNKDSEDTGCCWGWGDHYYSRALQPPLVRAES